ncbi:protoporphyrinogen oxidase [Nocardioides sp.]|uniref:protoporphyrinogen oxidase n=1 Tax=Nocardioides sp. TaxID=35761 RepID=UPI00263874D5|nr:protoporphyrinogen oxidase [Nocardioides sp.]MDI6911684.1 protoporphyrinogen oxidase [Nocardioides sp.]
MAPDGRDDGADARVVVVGAGISGLATAYFLRERLETGAKVLVLEGESRTGGKVRTASVAGHPVDTGPDAFLSRAPELRRLVDSLGLADLVVEPQSTGTFIWSRGRLRRLPPGTAFGLPERLWPLLRSGLLGPTAVARAGLDLLLPPTPLPEDPSVADVVRPRFGAGVYDRLVAPLLGGVHAGDPARLSATSTVPEIAAMARSGRSLYLTLRRRRRSAPPAPGRPSAPLVSLRGGLGALTGRLTEELGPGTVLTGTTARTIERDAAGCYTVRTDHGTVTARQVVLATPAYVAADLVADLAPRAAGLLREIEYVDVANITLAFRRDQVPALPPGTGFLVPPAEHELVVGCSWLSQKWPQPADDQVLVKAMVGRSGDTRWLAMDDAELVDGVRDALRRMLGIRAEPVASLVQRWPGAMPQYVVGHAARLSALDAALAAAPGLLVTGAAYRGVGLAGCVAQADATATSLLAAQGAHA